MISLSRLHWTAPRIALPPRPPPSRHTAARRGGEHEEIGEEVRDVEVIVKGEAKEIAALVLAVQERQAENLDAIMDALAADLKGKLSSAHIPE